MQIQPSALCAVKLPCRATNPSRTVPLCSARLPTAPHHRLSDGRGLPVHPLTASAKMGVEINITDD